jgi:hypothetical protein
MLKMILVAITGTWNPGTISLDGVMYKPKDFDKLRKVVELELATLDIIVNI